MKSDMMVPHVSETECPLSLDTCCNQNFLAMVVEKVIVVCVFSSNAFISSFALMWGTILHNYADASLLFTNQLKTYRV